jgi:hypothetical protein
MSEQQCTCNKENRGAKQHSSHCLAAQQPQVEDSQFTRRGEGREWTPNYVAKLYAFADGNKSSQHIAAMTRTFVTGWQAIADAHNAALAAEREKNKQADIELDRLDRERSQIRQQLLQTHAAIAEHNERWQRSYPCRGKIDVDLSALDKHYAELKAPFIGAIAKAKPLLVMGKVQDALFVLERADMNASIMEHDAEVRKPLVEALEWAWSIIANAGGGDWQRESKEWQDAAAKWRDEAYHPALAKEDK